MIDYIQLSKQLWETHSYLEEELVRHLKRGVPLRQLKQLGYNIRMTRKYLAENDRQLRKLYGPQ